MVCMTCKKLYRPKKNGIYIEEMMPIGNEPDQTWLPYKLWVGDLLECPQCGHQVVAGIPFLPVAEHYEESYKDIVARLGEKVIAQVQDCGNIQLGDQYAEMRRKSLAYDQLDVMLKEISEKVEEAVSQVKNLMSGMEG